ncbi:Smc5-Smc6 complex subunit KRE29 KNAG_0D02820 [Huiozyma naganishii CBS 8797]|uniref:Uncharacterized protein n=1 Tax=Huiozyma naganishii (strain ATCC MYA-139 / BCRC 22969 / CBS 8797 / KCTC 17520 / NBRC 10181 / NCYC 3082 / Yp74L-3) TaxID=1071383 RepID=J7S707_HUIN7|nr:hypothetical protein KNAG_0D02820 [Kazachstania naganishii CBS 8797]CCK70031.1 hypothetical protein KNAG_0D02820 [Kazachstania naganishii CBS 8797]
MDGIGDSQDADSSDGSLVLGTGLQQDLIGDAALDLDADLDADLGLDEVEGDSNLAPPPRNKQFGEVELRQFDLGKQYDEEIDGQFDRLRQVEEELHFSQELELHPTPTLLRDKLSQQRDNLKQRVKAPLVTEYTLDLISKETVSDKYKDWFLFTEGPMDGNNAAISDTSLTQLLIQFGATPSSLQSDFILKDEDLEHFDTFCDIYPVDYMMERIRPLILSHEDVGVATRLFTFFILDRNVYSSKECTQEWCTQVFESLLSRTTVEEFIAQYFAQLQLHDRFYFLLERLTKLIPPVRIHILNQLFPKTTAVINTFNELFDAQNYKDLLYFVLIIFGSDNCNFGESTVAQYFKDCILDACEDGANGVELTIIVGIINVFVKI